MEDLLLLMINEAIGGKHNAIRQTAQIAYDKLNRQNASYRNPSHELRSACFTALQVALESRRPKFIAMALSGLQKIIKDERFHSGIEPEDDSLWLPSQILRATSSLLTSSTHEENIVSVMRILLTMACSPACTLNGRILIEILNCCGECWRNTNVNSVAIKAASLTSASQCLRTFCSFLGEEAEEIKRAVPIGLISESQATAVYNEVIPVMQWLCSRLLEQQQQQTNLGHPNTTEHNYSVYLAECILTITSSLPANIHTNPHFTSFLWQKLCPALAAALGSPIRLVTDKKLYNNYKDILENENRGFYTQSIGRDAIQTRCIYLTTIQLLRCAGRNGPLRPMLEALFHRMLLLPSPSNRTEPLKIVREIFRSLERLIDLTVITIQTEKHTNSTGNTTTCNDEMALFRLMIDAMEECVYDGNAHGPGVVVVGGSSTSSSSASSSSSTTSSTNEQLCPPNSPNASQPPTSLEMSVECMVVLLKNIETLSEIFSKSNTTEKSDGNQTTTTTTTMVISEEVMEKVNRSYPQLKDADYMGPLTYQSMTSSTTSQHLHNDSYRETVYENSSSSESDPHLHQLHQQQQQQHRYNIHSHFSMDKLSLDTEEVEEEMEEQQSVSSEEEEDEEEGTTTPTTSSPTTSSSVQYEDTRTQQYTANWPYTPTLELISNSKSNKRKHTMVNEGGLTGHGPHHITPTSISDIDFDRENARKFSKILHTQLVPQLLQLRSSIEIDETIQEFASKFCDECYCTSTNFHLNSNSVKYVNDDDDNDHDNDDNDPQSTPSAPSKKLEKNPMKMKMNMNMKMNADAIYMAIYSALLFNLQLKKDNYYTMFKDTMFKEKIPLSEQQFVTSVQSNGAAIMLSSMSKDWLCELYQYILINDLLSPLSSNHDTIRHTNTSNSNNSPSNRMTIALINVLNDAAVCGPMTSITTVQQQQQQQQQRCHIQVTPTNSHLRGRRADADSPEKQLINRELREEAAKKICRRLLTCCWDSMVTILASGLDEHLTSEVSSRPFQNGGLQKEYSSARILSLSNRTKNKNGRTRIRNRNSKTNRSSSLYSLCLEGLQTAVKLSNTLNLQQYAGKILQMLCTNICEASGNRFTTIQAISMDVVLGGGLLLGAYNNDCWDSILNVCRRIDHLEHDMIHNLHGFPSMDGNRKSSANGNGNHHRHHHLEPSMMMMSEDETCVDVYNFLQNSSCKSNVKISSILQDYRTTIQNGSGGAVYLNPLDSNRVLCTLSQEMELFFNEVADQLSLPSLCQFLRHLGKCSRDQLAKMNLLLRKANRSSTGLPGSVANTNNTLSLASSLSSATSTPLSWWNGKNWRWRYRHMDASLLLLLPSAISSPLLFQRIGHLTLRVFRSSRPLYHLLKVWSIVAPHLMDAASHRDPYIAKRAIQCIQDVVIALLVEQSELPHFHFNEAILRPLQDIITQMGSVKREESEGCTSPTTTPDIHYDNEREAAIERVQDQIISFLYEIVDGHCNEIRSGWRSLFTILANVRSHLLLNNNGNILEIFRVFLESDNVLIFANAGLDCINCLLSFLDIVPVQQQQQQQQQQQPTSFPGYDPNHNEIMSNSIRNSDFLQEILTLLERCTNILGFMYNLLNCPTFHVTPVEETTTVEVEEDDGGDRQPDRQQMGRTRFLHLIDTNIPNTMENFTYFGNDYLQTKNEEHMISYRSLNIDLETIVNINEIDKKSGVLKVWFLLLEGLMSTLIVAPQTHQFIVLQMIFKQFKSLPENPSLEFAFYGVNHLLIPTLQDWLRYINDQNTINYQKIGNHKNPTANLNTTNGRNTFSSQIVKNFKHYCCMTTDLLVDFIKIFYNNQRIQTYVLQHRQHEDNNYKDTSSDYTKTLHIQQGFSHPYHPYERTKLKLIAEEREHNLVQREEDEEGDEDEQDEQDEHLKSISSSSSSSNTSDHNCLLSNRELVKPLANNARISSSINLALKQLLIVLVECSAHSQETIARIGVSCLKHVILTTGNLFDEYQWSIACSAIHRACSVTIAPLRQLSFAFNEKSNSFYGDCAIVKVAAKRTDHHSSPEELSRLHDLAQQVFLADNQRDDDQTNFHHHHHHHTIPSHHPMSTEQYPNLYHTCSGTIPAKQTTGYQQRFNNEEDRRTTTTTYSFLLYPQNNGFNTSNLENFVIRLPFKSIVLGLLANQMLLQLVAKLLLSRLKCVPQSVSMCIFNCYDQSTSSMDKANAEDNHVNHKNEENEDTSTTPISIDQEQYQLDFRSKEILLRCCVQFLTSALEFDSRPGLKFLMQKVANIQYSANLYRQMTSSWMIYYIALVDSFLNDINLYNLSTSDLLYILESCSRLNTTTLKQKENFVRYLFCLQDAWNLVCELYLTHHSDCMEMRNILATTTTTTNLTSTPSISSPNGNSSASLSQGVNYHKHISTYTFTRLEDETNGSNPKEENLNIPTNHHPTFEAKINEQRSNINGDIDVISPQIEQQRNESILKDLQYKRTSLAQLVIASMELLHSLPTEAESYLRMLITPTIREAFRLVQLQDQEM